VLWLVWSTDESQGDLLRFFWRSWGDRSVGRSLRGPLDGLVWARISRSAVESTVLWPVFADGRWSSGVVDVGAAR
jgi:hypothetical protein